MKVTIVLWGRFHAFNMAQQLQKHGCLHKLITCYPKFTTKKFGIPKSKVISFWPLMFYNRYIYKRLPSFFKGHFSAKWIEHVIFPKIAAKQIPDDTDIVIAWTGVASQVFKRAREIGATCVLDRGSTHPVFCQKILAEEYTRFADKGAPAIPQLEDTDIYNTADYVLIPSSVVKRTFLENGFPQNKLVIIPYGVDLSEFYSTPKPKDVFRVIFTGGMRLHKGVHYLIQAFAELKLPKAELWLVGSRSKETDYWFKKYRGFYTHFDAVPQKELVGFYNQCTVFCICSIQEGLALVQAQALACGLPVICTTHTGGEDIIQHGVNGFVIPIRDIESIKEKISLLYNNRALLNLMSKMAVVSRSGLSWDVYGEKLVQFLKQL